MTAADLINTTLTHVRAKSTSRLSWCLISQFKQSNNKPRKTKLGMILLQLQHQLLQPQLHIKIVKVRAIHMILEVLMEVKKSMLFMALKAGQYVVL